MGVFKRPKQPVLVVTKKRDDGSRTFRSKPKNAIDTTLRVRSTIDVIAQKDDSILGARLNLLQQASQRSVTTMYVSNGKRAHSMR